MTPLFSTNHTLNAPCAVVIYVAPLCYGDTQRVCVPGTSSQCFANSSVSRSCWLVFYVLIGRALGYLQTVLGEAKLR